MSKELLQKTFYIPFLELFTKYGISKKVVNDLKSITLKDDFFNTFVENVTKEGNTPSGVSKFDNETLMEFKIQSGYIPVGEKLFTSKKLDQKFLIDWYTAIYKLEKLNDINIPILLFPNVDFTFYKPIIFEVSKIEEWYSPFGHQDLIRYLLKDSFKKLASKKLDNEYQSIQTMESHLWGILGITKDTTIKFPSFEHTDEEGIVLEYKAVEKKFKNIYRFYANSDDSKEVEKYQKEVMEMFYNYFFQKLRKELCPNCKREFEK